MKIDTGTLIRNALCNNYENIRDLKNCGAVTASYLYDFVAKYAKSNYIDVPSFNAFSKNFAKNCESFGYKRIDSAPGKPNIFSRIDAVSETKGSSKEVQDRIADLVAEQKIFTIDELSTKLAEKSADIKAALAAFPSYKTFSFENGGVTWAYPETKIPAGHMSLPTMESLLNLRAEIENLLEQEYQKFRSFYQANFNMVNPILVDDENGDGIIVEHTREN